jgi:hypothetical protein
MFEAAVLDGLGWISGLPELTNGFMKMTSDIVARKAV